MSTDSKPSKSESEYFLKLDQELLKAQREKLDAERAAAERKSHHMKCPKCGADLEEIEFHHMKVDRCPSCRGMWLDAAEAELLAQVHDDKAGHFLRDLLSGLRLK